MVFDGSFDKRFRHLVALCDPHPSPTKRVNFYGGCVASLRDAYALTSFE